MLFHCSIWEVTNVFQVLFHDDFKDHLQLLISSDLKIVTFILKSSHALVHQIFPPDIQNMYILALMKFFATGKLAHEKKQIQKPKIIKKKNT